MVNSITCPNCNEENAETAQLCVRCGVWLNNAVDETMFGTASVQLREALTKQLETLDVQDQLKPGEVAIQLVESDHIIKMTYERPILLGRGEKARSNNNVFVDLTDYDAYSQGVSRDHALIRLVDHEYCIEDLSSSNGLAVNGQELQSKTLYSLESGDHIFLGRFALVFYYA